MTTRLLILLRHAKAKTYGKKGDHSRKLSSAGIVQARELGVQLESRKIMAQQAWISDAKRTTETAQEVLRLNPMCQTYSVPLLYQAYPEDVYDVVRSEATGTSAMIVGHEPTMSAAAAELLGHAEAAGKVMGGIPTATAVILRITGSWAELGPGIAELEDIIHVPVRR